MTNTNTNNETMTIYHKAQPVALKTLKKGAHFKRKLNALGYYRKEGFNHANKSQGLKASYTCGDPWDLGRSIELKPDTEVYPCDGFGELAEIYTADQYVLVEYILEDQPDSKYTKEVICGELFRSTSKQLVMAEAENIELYKIFKVPHGQEIDRKKALESYIIENRKEEAKKEEPMSYPIKNIPDNLYLVCDDFPSAVEELKEHLIDTVKEYPLTDENIDEAHYYAFNETEYIIYDSRAKEWLERHNIDVLDAIDFINRKTADMYGEPQEVPTSYETIVNKFVCFLGDEITPHAETVTKFLEALEA